MFSFFFFLFPTLSYFFSPRYVFSFLSLQFFADVFKLVYVLLSLVGCVSHCASNTKRCVVFSGEVLVDSVCVTVTPPSPPPPPPRLPSAVKQSSPVVVRNQFGSHYES